jgi:hypothetical protein
VLPGKSHEAVPIEGRTRRFGQRSFHDGVALGVRQNLQLPGLARQSHFPELLWRQLVRRGSTPAIGDEILLAGQIFELRKGLLQQAPVSIFVFAGPPAGSAQSRRARGAQVQKMAARDIQVFSDESFSIVHNGSLPD